MRHRCRGFTLLELLVVIAIIIVLIGLILPALASIRQQAHAAATRALVQNLSAVIQAYHADFKGYPGPVSNGQLRVAGNSAASPPGCGIRFTGGSDVTRMSMAENLYLGLLGGLAPATPPTNPPTFVFDSAKAGAGPRWLGATSRKLPPYTDNVDLSRDAGGRGFYKDENETAAFDTEIPEFVDRIPTPMPVLYLRARVGAPGVVSWYSTPGGEPDQQYDVEQVRSYTHSDIGLGKLPDPARYTGYPADGPYTVGGVFPFHGLSTADQTATILDPAPPGLKRYYPYDLYAALLDPTLPRVPATVTAPANRPRQKDGYILISAGIDRIYGTEDDITNFGRY